MPKYSLNDRGILTITNETDGGIFSLAAWVKKAAMIIGVLGALSMAVLFFVKYVHYTDFPYSLSIIKNKVSSLSLSSNISLILSRINISYPFAAIIDNMKGQDGFYRNLINSFPAKASRLFYIIREFVHSIFN